MRGSRQRELDAAAGRVGDHELDGCAARRSGASRSSSAQPHDDLLEAEMARRRREPPREPLASVAASRKSAGADEERDAVPLQPPLRVALAEQVVRSARVAS